MSNKISIWTNRLIKLECSIFDERSIYWLSWFRRFALLMPMHLRCRATMLLRDPAMLHMSFVGDNDVDNDVEKSMEQAYRRCRYLLYNSHYFKAYHRKHIERKRTWSSEYYRQHKERMKATHSLWARTHPEYYPNYFREHRLASYETNPLAN